MLHFKISATNCCYNTYLYYNSLYYIKYIFRHINAFNVIEKVTYINRIDWNEIKFWVGFDTEVYKGLNSQRGMDNFL